MKIIKCVVLTIFIGIHDVGYVSPCCCTGDLFDGDHPAGICRGVCKNYCNTFGCNCGTSENGMCWHCLKCTDNSFYCDRYEGMCKESTESCAAYYSPLNRFKKIDLNSDGKITLLEAKSHLTNRNISLEVAEFRHHFNAMDINQDAVIHPHEFDEDLKPDNSNLILLKIKWNNAT